MVSEFTASDVTRLREMPAGSGVPETSATRPPSEFDETLPEFSDEYIEVEYLLSGTGE